MSRGLGGLGLDRELGMIMNANRPNPAGLQSKIVQQQKAGITPQLLDVLASQKLIKEKQDAKTAMMANAAPNAGTIAQQQDAMLKQQAVADLQREVDVAKQVGVANAMMNTRNKKMRNAALKKLTGAKPTRMTRGIAGAPVPKTMMAAQGGIVGFQSGNSVDLPESVEPKPPIRLHTGVIERQRERREWDKLYGANYNTDGSLKSATPSSVVGNIVGQVPLAMSNLIGQGSGLSALGSSAQYVPGDRRIIPKGPDFATQKFFQSPPIGSPTFREETGETPPMPVLTTPPMQGPPMPPPKPPTPTPELEKEGIPTALPPRLEYKPNLLGNLAATLRAYRGGIPAAAASALDARDEAMRMQAEKFNIESDLTKQRLENDKLATKLDGELKQIVARGSNRSSLFGKLNDAQDAIRKATENFNLGAGRQLQLQMKEYLDDYSKKGGEKRLKRYTAAKQAYDMSLDRTVGDLRETAQAIKDAIARLDFDTSRPATQI